MINVRVFYTKTGRARFISHLDMMRFMTRALKRSGLPVWYTEGFNRHIYTTFALPLSLGFESMCEFMDFRLLPDEFDMEEVATRLNACLTVNDDNSAVGNAERLHNFAREIEEAGCVEYVYLCISPDNGCDRCLEREASLYFFCIIVADCITVGRITESVGASGNIEHSLCKRSLSASAVSYEGYVSDFFDIQFHGGLLLCVYSISDAIYYLNRI